MGQAFRALHERDDAFILPDSWDVGTAGYWPASALRRLQPRVPASLLSTGQRDNTIDPSRDDAHQESVAGSNEPLLKWGEVMIENTVFNKANQPRNVVKMKKVCQPLQVAGVLLLFCIGLKPLPACAPIPTDNVSKRSAQKAVDRPQASASADIPAASSIASRRGGMAKVAKSFVGSHAFRGDIVVAKGTRFVYAAAYGMRNREKGLHNTISTKFQIGSVSKWITVIAILKLVDEGKLSLDAPITTYLQNYPSEIGSQITLADLLSNMSGLRDRLPTSLINDPTIAASSMSAAQAVKIYAEGPLVSSPGSAFDYAHTNWVLVQAIVEHATGVPLEALLQKALFSPLRLNATGVTHGSFKHIRSGAIAYESDRVDAARDLHIIPNFLIPTGTIYSNCGDLIRLAHVVYEGSILTPSALKRFTTVRYPPEDYALGGRVKYEDLGGVRKTLAFEVGSFGGFKALVVHVIGDDVTVAILNNTNMSEDELSQLSGQLLAQFYSQPYR